MNTLDSAVFAPINCNLRPISNCNCSNLIKINVPGPVRQRRGVILALSTIFVLILLSPVVPIQSFPAIPIPITNETINTNSSTGRGPVAPAPALLEHVALIEPSQSKPSSNVVHDSSLRDHGSSSHNSNGHGGTSQSSSSNSASNPNNNVGNTESLPDEFDDKAIQRAFVVMAGLGLLLVAYFGIKFMCIKKRGSSSMPISSLGPSNSKSKSSSIHSSSSGRYGLLESTEMDIMDSIDEEDDNYLGDWRDEEVDSDEAESNTLFDLRSHRHT